MTAMIASKTRVYRDMKKFLNEVIYMNIAKNIINKRDEEDIEENTDRGGGN